MKATAAQTQALTKLADGGGSNQMRRSTNDALHARGWMHQGRITAAGLEVIGRVPLNCPDSHYGEMCPATDEPALEIQPAPVPTPQEAERMTADPVGVGLGNAFFDK